MTVPNWPMFALAEGLKMADGMVDQYADAYDAILPGLGDVFRHTWQIVRPQPTCDCPMDPHHRWNCALTPIWAQTIRDLGCNPWTVTEGVVHRFGLDLTPESFQRLGDALNRITEAERKAWNPAQPDTEPEDNK